MSMGVHGSTIRIGSGRPLGAAVSAGEALMRAGTYWNLEDWDGGSTFSSRTGSGTATKVGGVTKVEQGATFTADDASTPAADFDLAKFDGSTGWFTTTSIPAANTTDLLTLWTVFRRRSGASAGTRVLIGAKDGTTNNATGIIINLLAGGALGGVIGDGSGSRTPSTSVGITGVTATAFVTNARTAISAISHNGSPFTASAGSPGGIGNATASAGLHVGHHPAGGSLFDGEILAFGYAAAAWDTDDLALIRSEFTA